MIRLCILAIAWPFLTVALAAQDRTNAAPPGSEAPVLEEVLVTGEQPGPALWKVSSGDHILWMLGEVSPLPAKVKWRSKQLESLLASSQEVLLQNERGVRLSRQQMAAQAKSIELPDGQVLKDVISPDLYARAEASQKRFGGRVQIDRLRPFAAANVVYMTAVTKLDLLAFSASFAVVNLAQKAHVRITYISTPEQTFDERLRNLEQPYSVLCLQRAVESIEDGGSGVRRLANAWSLGDIDALRRLVPLYAVLNESHKAGKCLIAEYGGEQRADEYIAKRTESWLSSAERALRKNQSTIAVVPIAELLAPDGYSSALRAKGFEVVEPK